MAHFDERNIVSIHGTWAVTHQGIAALDYAMFFSADMLEIINPQTVGHLGYVNLDDFSAALEAGLAFHGTQAERDARQLEQMREDQEASIAHAKEVHSVDGTDSDVVESENDEPQEQTEPEEQDHKPFSQMTKAELKTYADENGIDYPSDANKSELRSIVENA